MTKTRKPNASAAITAIIMLLSVVFILIRPECAFAAAKPKTYKVGANPIFGVNKAENGYSGLACDYLNSIGKYTGDKYIYVDGTAEELFSMLKNGKIDIIPCVTEFEREFYEKKLGGSDGSLFKTTGNSLISRFSAVYVYDKGEYADTVLNDAATIRQMTIGYLKSDEQNYFIDGKFFYSEIEGANFVPYEELSEMYSDFESGKIDAVVKDCLRPWHDETIVYRFTAASGLFVVRSSDKDAAAKLESGLLTLFTDYPMFYGDVYERHVSNFGSQKFAYNNEESDFRKTHSEITLGFNLQTDVMMCYDHKNGTLGGVVGSLLKRYTEMTGLKVNVKVFNDLDSCFEALDKKEIDMIYGGVTLLETEKERDCYATAPAVNSPLVLAGKKPEDGAEEVTSIAVDERSYYVSKLRMFYPNAEITPTKSIDEACMLAQTGKCDAVCLNSYDAMSIKSGDYPDFEILRVLPIYSTECFALRTEDRGLVGITENVLLRINSSDLIAEVYNIVETVEHISSGDDSKTGLFVAILSGSAVIAAGIIILITLESKRRVEIDPLTGGATKKTFIEKSMKAIKKSGTLKWTLAIMDIDKFKFINDRLGYEEGNRMLERMYKTLSDHMENGETYARISDDNFACCFPDMPDSDVIGRLNSIFEEFGRRNSLFVSYPVLFSAGVCRLEQCVEKYGLIDFNAAIDCCNIAKKTIKGLHRSAIAFYDGKIREQAMREKDFENVMPAALENGEFMCYIQPKYGARSRRIEGGEALIRWKSSDFGFVFPDQFIPIAEKNGFVVELDFFILEEVCKAMRRWFDKGLKPVVISVNQSRMHLTHDDYIWRLREIVDKYSIPYDCLELEITETVFNDNAELLLQVMQKLHDIGFQLSIDDFGSGYSSLNMLKDIPADVVKIDREFFNGTVNSDKGRAVITTVVDLAKKLRMHVISEGVETLDQVEFLDEINCDLIQGYYFAKPMPMKDFEELWFKDLEEHSEEQ